MVNQIYNPGKIMTNSDLLYSQIPIERINSIGHQTSLREFQEVGKAFLREFKDRCQLLPSSHFMDIGCGIGRLAIPLTDYLDTNGRYEGFDITPDNVKWCQEHIAARHSNFGFKVADIFNHCYNPEGKHKAIEYQFPYQENAFDVACAASVFTHLLADDSERYLSETSRVLKPNGYFLGTFFLLNEPSVTALRQQKSSLPFFHELKNCLVTNPRVPEAAVAYDEDFIIKIYREAGLEIKEIHYGLWSGREPTVYGGYQDMIIAKKTAS
ncbi:MAG: class I SAM-dependent methyltransferase [Nitrosomonas sp.]|nr:class I SAM-dependent methyltransferase [Nitrosomonas sp.]